MISKGDILLCLLQELPNCTNKVYVLCETCGTPKLKLFALKSNHGLEKGMRRSFGKGS
jgi:hypothetical protein